MYVSKPHINLSYTKPLIKNKTTASQFYTKVSSNLTSNRL